MSGTNHHSLSGSNRRSIEVAIGPDGKLSIEANGYTGADCETATAFLEEALGLLQERTHKPQFHTKPAVKTRNQNANQQEVKS